MRARSLEYSSLTCSKACLDDDDDDEKNCSQRLTFLSWTSITSSEGAGRVVQRNGLQKERIDITIIDIPVKNKKANSKKAYFIIIEM